MMLHRYDGPTRLTPADFACAALAGVAAAALSLVLSSMFDPAIYGSNGFNIWFQADPPRVLRAMSDPSSHYHYRTSVHPLFSLLTTPAVRLLMLLGLAPVAAGRAVVAASGFASSAFLLLAARGLGLPRNACLALIAAYLVSATYLHWFCLIETYAVGAASVCLMLWIMTCAPVRWWWAWWLGSAATLAVTVTNWMLGLSATFFRLGLRRMVPLNAAVLLAAIALSLLQHALYPEARLFFLPGSVLDEHQYAQVHRTSGTAGWSPLANLRAVMLSGAVAPQPHAVPGDQAGGNAEQTIVTNQTSVGPWYSPVGWLGCLAWGVLIVVGALTGWRDHSRRAVYAALCAYLAGQIALDMVYGPITFLYATNSLPAFLLLAAFGWFGRYRVVSTVAAAVFIGCAAIANGEAFNAAVKLANAISGGS